MKLYIDITKMKKLVKPWEDLARKNRNKYIELYNKKDTSIGIMEQGKDGFTEIIIDGPYHRFTKVWLYPPANANGWVKASGLLRKNR